MHNLISKSLRSSSFMQNKAQKLETRPLSCNNPLLICLQILLFVGIFYFVQHGISPSLDGHSDRNRSAFGFPSPDSVLPALNSILGMGLDGTRVLAFYNSGLAECNNRLTHLGNENNREFLLTHSAQEVFEQLGIIFSSFGPGDCEMDADCWSGLLTCGTFNEASFKVSYYNHSRYKSDDTILPMYMGWSLRAFHMNMIVKGREILLPPLQLVSLTVPAADGSSIGASPVEVLIGKYVLTVPGNYSVESRVQSLYPGALFNFSAEEKSQGLDLQHVQSFGRTGHRPLRDKISTAEVQMPLRVHVSAAARRNRDAPSQLPELPFCTDGNHRGRWLLIPDTDSVLRLCGSCAYISTIAKLSRTRADVIKEESMTQSYLSVVVSLCNRQ
jgi:hypothetical protein